MREITVRRNCGKWRIMKCMEINVAEDLIVRSGAMLDGSVKSDETR